MTGEVQEIRLSVQGLKCGGCIAKAQTALKGLPGYRDSEFDLKTGTAVVRGSLSAEQAARAVTGAGYPATVRG
ncbi:MAG: heavy metal-associated domain-containing protein [Pseudomonadota bacterium]